MNTDALTIGQLASAADVNVQTVRYYERRGLIPRPQRTPSGYRQYTPDVASRLRFIKRAQDLGFSLQEIADLLALRVKHPSACAAVESKAREKVEVIDGKIAQLKRLRAVLQRLAATCQARGRTGECPILEALEDHVAGDT